MDTFYIAKIYLQRPIELMGRSLGQWFVEATNLDDKDLATDGSAFSAKEKIITKGYNNIPNLIPILQEYNRSKT